MWYVITTLILLVYLVVVWLLGRYMPLHGPADVWILRGVLAVLGIIGAAVAYFFVHKVNKAKAPAGDGNAQPGGADDLDALVREAVRRLKQSTLGRGSNLGTLPLVFVLGDAGSTKTTVLIHSALDPELLAGQVYRDNEVLPTSTANIWYTRQAIFVDPAGAMMGQAERWRKLVRLLQPEDFPRRSENVRRPHGQRWCVSIAKAFCNRARVRVRSRRHADCRYGCRRFRSCWESAFPSMFCSQRWTGLRSSRTSCGG